MVSGRVTELWRFPVKSMAGEQVDRVELDHNGVVGDRRFAVRDDESGLIASAKRPGRWGVLRACQAATAADGSVLVSMPDGPTFPAGDPLLDTALSELTGRRVTFEHVDGRSAHASGDNEAEYPELDHVRLRGRMAFPTAMLTDARSYVDLSAVHLMTPSTIAAVAAASEADDVSSSRFRPNIVIDSGPVVEFLEDDWAATTLCVGPSATLQRVISAPRCIMTSVEQPGLTRDHRTLCRRSPGRNRVDSEWLGPLPCAGLFAEVHAPGTVSAGDALTIERAANSAHDDGQAAGLPADDCILRTIAHTHTRSTIMKSTHADLDTIMASEVATLKGTQWGEMAVNINRFEPGADLSPLLAQVSTGSCPVPHWGYLIEGSWTVGYTDGSIETINAGEVFYLPSGHDRVFTETGCLMAEFSPAAESAAFMEQVAPLLAE